jgi:outer membrane immunogenic protein
MAKKFLMTVAVFATLAGGPAIAADMALKAAPPAPVYNWTGFYIGGNVGYSWGTSDSTVNFLDPAGFVIASSSGSFSLDGVIGGGQIGYNWQTGSWVWGLEADIQASGQNGTGTFTCAAGCSVLGPVTETLNQKIDWFGTARGRLGFTVTPTLLLYATGGLAYGDIETNGTISDPTTFSTHALKSGWTAGGGIEDHVTPNWSVKLEYLFMDLGNVSSNGAITTGVIIPGVPHNCIAACPVNHLSTTFASSGSGITDSILRLGVNYKFN